jgi:chromosome segregation ATPase
VKQEFNKDMENLKKKNQIETLEIKSSLNQIKKYKGEYHHHQKKKKNQKNTGESPSSRLTQVEDRISEIKDKIDIKEKTELLDKRLKSCKRNTQELSDSIKRPKL